MKKRLGILVVDDHDLIIEGYKSILRSQTKYDINLICANNCEEASKIITGNHFVFDVAIFDWILPPHGAFLNGGDLAILCQKEMPNTKTLIITSHEEAFELYNINKNINPNGILVKSDFCCDALVDALSKIFQERYYSETVKRSIRKVNSQGKFLDNYNRQIVLLLSNGIKTKNLPRHLPLTLSAIDKRKAQIKDYFLINGGNDEDILREAKKLGLI